MRSTYFIMHGIKSSPNSKNLNFMEAPLGRPTRLYRAAGKRLFDIAFSATVLLLLWPVIAILALIVALDGSNPLFGHERVGRGDRRFRCLKIRTMVADAERRLERVLASDSRQAAEWHANRKLVDDPRITRFGSFLRATSLDELPQFWNVLVGDMSLVGPRPITGEELAQFGEHRTIYTSVRPGLSGPWQVGERNQLSFHARIAIDVNYARTHSFTQDIAIIFRTVTVVLRRTGC